MPPHTFVNFRYYLIKSLTKLALTSDINTMTPSNTAIMLGPELLWAKNEGTFAERAAAAPIHILQGLNHPSASNWLFPEEVEFNASEAFVPFVILTANYSSYSGNDFDLGPGEEVACQHGSDERSPCEEGELWCEVNGLSGSLMG